MSNVIKLTECQGDIIEVHATGCADIAKKKNRGLFYNGTGSIDMPAGASERDVWLLFNEDFLANEGEDGAWPITFLPCCHKAGLAVNPDRSWTE